MIVVTEFGRLWIRIKLSHCAHHKQRKVDIDLNELGSRNYQSSRTKPLHTTTIFVIQITPTVNRGKAERRGRIPFVTSFSFRAFFTTGTAEKGTGTLKPTHELRNDFVTRSDHDLVAIRERKNATDLHVRGATHTPNEHTFHSSSHMVLSCFQRNSLVGFVILLELWQISSCTTTWKHSLRNAASLKWRILTFTNLTLERLHFELLVKHVGAIVIALVPRTADERTTEGSCWKTDRVSLYSITQWEQVYGLPTE